MNGETIVEIIEKLTGSCYPYGSESIDEERMSNMLTKICVAKKLIDDIEEAMNLLGRNESSICRIALKAKDFLWDLQKRLNENEHLQEVIPVDWLIDRDAECKKAGIQKTVDVADIIKEWREW